MLYRHSLVADKIKEFRCRICGAAYSEKRNLEAHKIKHDETRFRKLLHLRLNAFNFSGVLLFHYSKCRNSFPSYASFVSLFRDEAKQRKVRVCPICGYIGYHRSPFVWHMIDKHNDTSYGTVEMHKCDQCNFQSCYLPTLNKHKKTVHGNY